MNSFEFDTAPTPGANRSGAVTDCEACGGDRLIPVEIAGSESAADPPHEIYAPCPACHPLAQGEREPVAEDAWWKR